MINLNHEDYSWVSVNKLTVNDLTVILNNIEIDRYALGGVVGRNISIREHIGDASFWNNLVVYKGKLRLGSVNEDVLPEKELSLQDLFECPVNKLLLEL